MTTELAFDEGLYTQSLFRKLLDGMARPGKIQTVDAPSLPGAFDQERYLIGILLTLLDHEVTFAMDPLLPETVSFLRVFTMSRPAEWDVCDYAVVDGSIEVSLHKLKKGNFTFPDEGATLICGVNALSSRAEAAAGGGSRLRIELEGPGIKEKAELYVSGLLENTLSQLMECNEEFPLGIDVILHDRQGRVCCIPRSAKFSWEVL